MPVVGVEGQSSLDGYVVAAGVCSTVLGVIVHHHCQTFRTTVATDDLQDKV